MPLHETDKSHGDLPAYVFSLSVTGTIESVNSTMLRDLRYEAEEITGRKRFTELLTVGSRVFYDTHFFPLIRLHGSYDEIFLTLMASDGEEIPVLINARMTGEGGSSMDCAAIRVSKRLKFEKEIREARRVAEEALLNNEHLQELREDLENQHEMLEKRLQHLSQQNAELVQINSILSHDLQEPLRKVALFSRLLEQEGMGMIRPEWNSHLGKISRSADSMREMILSIHDFLAIGRHRLQPALHSLRAIVGYACERSLNHYTTKKWVVECDDAMLFGDLELLTRLFYELITNSMRFTEPSTPVLKIRITADSIEENIFRETADRYRYSGFTRVRYSDNGIGFPQQFSEDIFILFRKAHLYGEGQGVGLAVCKKITALHHGWISASSEPGNGTTFSLFLPEGPELQPGDRQADQTMNESVAEDPGNAGPRH